ncbi:MAG TPA: GNAT family N-acetyltransferase [Pirellulales bacterium]|nr:GNAT family N-acetyltransferase [Pirellulales bacterium]
MLATGCAGDHPVVHHLLTEVFQGPSRDNFYSSLDDPFYEPRDRLLIKRAGQSISHVLITKRVMHFGSLSFPADCLSWLATLPEFRQLGYASRLVRAADETMRREGAVLCLLKTRVPHFFRRQGWALCGRHSHARAGSRDLLAQLSARGLVPGESSVGIRPWRQVELPALMRLYQDMTAGRAGHFERTEAYWRWLISRKGFERIYVAVDGPDNFELEDDPTKLVGYLITSEDRVLELAAARTHRHVARELLARACSEAIERDYNMLTLHAPADDPLMEIFRIAGGTLHCTESEQGEVYMAKLMNPIGFLKQLCPELHRRADAVSLTRPCELGLVLDGEKYRLIVSRRSVKLGRNRIGRSYLQCSGANVTRLLLGHLDIDEALADGRLRASTQVAAELGRTLFPRLPLWRPPLDEIST